MDVKHAKCDACNDTGEVPDNGSSQRFTTQPCPKCNPDPPTVAAPRTGTVEQAWESLCDVTASIESSFYMNGRVPTKENWAKWEQVARAYGDAREAAAAPLIAAIRAALARQDDSRPFREVVEAIMAGKGAP